MEKMKKQQKLQEQEAIVKAEGNKTDDGTEEIFVGKSLAKVPKMPYCYEERDFMDSYLGRFEWFTESQKWNRKHYVSFCITQRLCT